MKALDVLQSRVSVGVLGEPAPSEAQLQEMLRAAVRAPDHGHMRPWRFLILQGQQRDRLADLLCTAKQAQQPEVTSGELKKLASKPFRAPTVLVTVAEIALDQRIPAIEQIIATGAAVQNILLAAHAQGVGAMWRTGGLANHSLVKAGLGFTDKDEVVGFIYLGTPAGTVKSVPVEDPQQYLRTLPP